MPQFSGGSNVGSSSQIVNEIILSEDIKNDEIKNEDIKSTAAIARTKLADVSGADKILGRKTAGAGAEEELTIQDILDMVGAEAQGNIIYFNGTDWVLLAPGTSGQFLKTLGAGANPVWGTPAAGTKIYISPTEVTFTAGNGGSGAGTEHTCFSTTIPGGILGTNAGVRFKIPMSGVGTSGAAGAITIRIKFGGTTYITLTLPTASNAISGLSGFVEGFILADGATGAQKIIAWCDLRENKGESSGDASVIIDKLYSEVAIGAGAKDSTADQAFAVSVQMVNNAQNNGVIEALILEKIIA